MTGGLSFLQRLMMEKFYREAKGDPSKLPWHRQEPGALLMKCATAGLPGRALDVGCGSGVFSRYLAELGYDVVAIDLNDSAVSMARALSDAGPAFNVVKADILEFDAQREFDIVLDSGCLHNFNDAGVRRYVKRLKCWLAPKGDFILERWGKRHVLDWRPIGPYRRTISTIESAFSKHFQLCETLSEVMDVPLPLGPKVLGVQYRFRHLQ